jgi:hypothetical protein
VQRNDLKSKAPRRLISGALSALSRFTKPIASRPVLQEHQRGSDIAARSLNQGR